MSHLTVTLYIRIITPDGKRKMCKPVYASRGRLKPLYAADAKGNSLGHHPEGEYYLRYAGRTEAVGNDPYVALDRLEQRMAEVRQSARTNSAGLPEQPSQAAKPRSVRAPTLDEAITEYLTTGKAAEKNWRKHTLQCYTLALRLFRESCSKTYLNDVDGDDLRRFKVFLRKQQARTKTVRKKIDDRTVWNHFNNVVSFLNSYGIRDLIPQSEWPTFEEKTPEAYDPEDVIGLFQFADDDERDVIEFFCGVGFRNGEGTHTEWPDIDYRNKEVTIYSKAERFGWKVKDSEKRTVGISDRLVERLKARHNRHPSDGLVFPNSCGKPDKHLLRIIKRVALRAGLNCGHCMGTHNRKRVSCRTLPVCHKWLVQTFRKTWAPFQAEVGAAIPTISRDLGHSSLDTTRIYLASRDRRHATRRIQINAADALLTPHTGEEQARVN
jgi:integrase/recombinase XerD